MSSGKKAVTFTDQDPEVFEYEQTLLPVEEEKKNERSQERKDWFMDMMAVGIGIRRPPKLLDELSLEGVAKYIADGKCKNIITMAGAGISTSAGIPDYRSPGTGLMDQMKDKYPNIKNVTDLFNIQFFLRDPHPFFERSRRFFEISLKPTASHYFIRLLHEKGLLLRHFTQNIDTLERLAGVPADKVVEAHGSYYTSHCMLCDAQYSFLWMEERVLKDEVPTCVEEHCNGVIKPDIVMFGESLPDRFGELAEEDTLKCDLLIIMGTTLAVLPFSSLTSKVKSSTPRLYINMDRGKTGKKHPMSDLIFGGSFDFDCEDNVRDVFKQEKCDDACYALADQLGWGAELRSLVKSEHERIDEEDKVKGNKIKVQPLTDFTETTTTTTTPAKTGAPSASETKKKQKTPAKTAWVVNSKAGGKPADHKLTKAKGKDLKPDSSSSPSRPPRPGNKAASLHAAQHAEGSEQQQTDCPSPRPQQEVSKHTSVAGAAGNTPGTTNPSVGGGGTITPRSRPPAHAPTTSSSCSAVSASSRTGRGPSGRSGGGATAGKTGGGGTTPSGVKISSGAAAAKGKQPSVTSRR